MSKRKGFETSERKRMLLSSLGLRFTSESWYVLTCIISLPIFIIIAYSFIELVRYIFKQPGVKVFLRIKISQDPLEKFFGCQRQRGGIHENPTI